MAYLSCPWGLFAGGFLDVGKVPLAQLVPVLLMPATAMKTVGCKPI